MNPEFSPEHNNVFAAFIKAQSEFPEINFTKQVSAGRNYSFKYADLASIKAAITPVLTANGLAVLTPAGDGFSISVLIIHSSGEWMKFTGEIPAPILESIKGPQDGGKIITYYRRYFLSAALGIVAEDDTDAEGMSGGRAVQIKGFDKLSKEDRSKIYKQVENRLNNVEATEKWLRGQKAAIYKHLAAGRTPGEIVTHLAVMGIQTTKETLPTIQSIKSEFNERQEEAATKGGKPSKAEK